MRLASHARAGGRSMALRSNEPRIVPQAILAAGGRMDSFESVPGLRRANRPPARRPGDQTEAYRRRFQACASRRSEARPIRRAAVGGRHGSPASASTRTSPEQCRLSSARQVLRLPSGAPTLTKPS
jgi:hypothetical protein